MSFGRKYLPLKHLFRNFSKTLLKNSNYYKSLGLTPSASSSDIKAAYYRLSKIYHPDRNNGSEASAKIFREISAAYEVLGKSESRKNYDREKLSSFESRKPSNAPRTRNNKRNRNGTGSSGKNTYAQELRWRTKPSNSFRNAHKLNEKEVEALLMRSLRIVLFSVWYYGSR